MENLTAEELSEMVVVVNSYNGALDYLDFYYMEDFDELLSGFDPTDIANKIHFGDFKPTDDYFMFNAYANLVSVTEYEFGDLLDDYKDEIIEEYNAVKDEL